MKGLDDGPDGLNDAAFDRALGIKPARARKVCALCGAPKPRKSVICNSVVCISNVWVKP